MNDICTSINVDRILPSLVSNGLVTLHDQQCLSNPVYTDVQKQHKLAFLIVSLKEDCVKKFLQCLSETRDYEPHNTLFEKLCKIGKSS